MATWEHWTGEEQNLGSSVLLVQLTLPTEDKARKGAEKHTRGYLSQSINAY